MKTFAKTLRFVLPAPVLALLCAAQASIAATEISPGVLYPGGTQLTVSSLGIEFSVPRSWQALLPEGAEMLIMEPIDAVARLIVSAAADSDDSTVRQAMSQRQTLDFSTRLTPVADAAKQGALYHQRYRVEGANPQNLLAEAWAHLGDNHTAFYVILLQPEDQAEFGPVGKNLATSVSFTRPMQPGIDIAKDPDAGNIDWEQRLKGRALRYLKTESGYSADRRFKLCSDHSFVYSDRDNYLSSDAISNFSAASQSGSSGRWRISGDQLVLNWSDGSSARYTLSRRYVEEWSEWGTFVDQDRWFEVANNACN